MEGQLFSLHIGSAAMNDWPWHSVYDDASRDVYVEIKLEGSVTLRTEGTGRSRSPAWNEELQIIGNISSNISMTIRYASQSDTEDAYIGRVDITLGALLARCTNDRFVALDIAPIANSRSSGIITIKPVAHLDFEIFISHLQRAAQRMSNVHPNKATYLFHLGIGYQSRFEHLGNLVDVEESIVNLSKAVELADDKNPSKAPLLMGLGLSQRYRFEHLLKLCDIDDSIANLRAAVELTREDHPNHFMHLFNLGASYALRFQLLDEQADLEGAILNLEKAVEVNADCHPDQGYFALLGTLHHDRFETLGEPIDLDGAISNLQHAVDLIDDSHSKKPGHFARLVTRQRERFQNLGILQDLECFIQPERCQHLNTLGLAQQRRFERFREQNDIDNSISNLENAAELVDDDHPLKPGTLANLGISQQLRFEHVGEMEDLESSISNMQKAVDRTPDNHPNFSMYLSNLGLAQQSRFERLGLLPDIESSLINLKRAIHCTDGSHPNKVMYMANIGISQQHRFGFLGEVADIEESITNLQHAVENTSDDDEDKPMYLTNLGNSYDLRFEQFGGLADLVSAIANKQKAVDLTHDGHPDKLTYLSNLANSQRSRFHLLGDISDLEKSIVNITVAVEQTDDEDPNKPGWLLHLGCSKQSRFTYFGGVADIDESIANLQWAVDHVGDDHSDKAIYFSNLGISHQLRFERFGVKIDFDNAISNHQKAVDLTDDGHPRKPSYLSNLGNCQRQGHDRDIGKAVELETCISNLQQAVDLTPDNHSSRPTYLSNVGLALHTRFARFGELADIDNSILILKHAANITMDGHPNKPRYLSILGVSLESRFQRLSELRDLDASISYNQHAVNLSDDGQPEKAVHLSHLAENHILRFKHLGEPSDFATAVSLYKAAATSKSAYPDQALLAAREWAEISRSGGDFWSALNGYRTALEILPKVAWLGLDTEARQDSLSHAKSEDLGCLAANCAIRLGLLEEAVELLDLGRSVFWQQASSLRGDFTTLREDEPILAEELSVVGRKLDQGNFSHIVIDTSEYGKAAHRNMEDIIRERHRLVDVWEGLLEKIRERPKFKYFLKSIPFPQLRQAANVGQVVIINVSPHGADALIFGASGPIEHVPLDVDLDELSELYGDIFKNRPVSATPTQRRNYTTRYLKPALRATWEDILIHVFEKMGISLECSESVPTRRIWWYLTGPLTFIPIHAAGPGEGGISKVVISSYVTTLDSLSQAQRNGKLKSQSPWRLLSVSQPNTPAQCPLPRSTEEVERIARVVSSAGWSEENIVHLNGSDATVLRVSDAIDQCSWIHFACHGLQDPTLGMKSAFALYDGGLELGHISSKRLAHGEFAFLSVCHAASGLQNLPGEAMHLAAGLQFVGFASVIATMWGINDEDAPKVALHTYEYLFRNNLHKCDPSEAAIALNYAVRKLREEPEITLDRWAPFIHFGI